APWLVASSLVPLCARRSVAQIVQSNSRDVGDIGIFRWIIRSGRTCQGRPVRAPCPEKPGRDEMNWRIRVSVFALVTVLLPSVALAQAPRAKAAAVAPRTPDGKPDLQGFWDFRTLTPLQRPANQADKTFLSEDEAKALQQQNVDRRARAAAP